MNLHTVKDFLATEGFRPNIDEDGDIFFKYEGKTLVVDSYENDQAFIRVMLPNVWTIESDDERNKAYRCTSITTREYKLAKVFVTPNDDVSLSIELLLPSEQDFINIFGRCLSIITSAHQSFVQAMQAE